MKARILALILCVSLVTLVLPSVSKALTVQIGLLATPGSPITSITEQDPASVAAALDTAINTQNPTAALALFAINATIEYSGSCIQLGLRCGEPLNPVTDVVWTGSGSIYHWLSDVCKDHLQVIEIGKFQVSDNNVTWTTTDSADGLRALNLGPLTIINSAVVRNGKIEFYTYAWGTESAAILASANMEQSVSVGVLDLGAVIPLIALYYVVRVRRLFEGVPRLQTPWFLIGGGVVLLFVSLIAVAISGYLRTFAPDLGLFHNLALVAATLLILAGLVHMQRVWTIPSSE